MLEVTGGAISYGEDEEDCARRELKEETSIDAKSIKFLYKIHNNTKDRLGYMVLYYVYLAKTDIDEQPPEISGFMKVIIQKKRKGNFRDK